MYIIYYTDIYIIISLYQRYHIHPIPANSAKLTKTPQDFQAPCHLWNIIAIARKHLLKVIDPYEG